MKKRGHHPDDPVFYFPYAKHFPIFFGIGDNLWR